MWAVHAPAELDELVVEAACINRESIGTCHSLPKQFAASS